MAETAAGGWSRFAAQIPGEHAPQRLVEDDPFGGHAAKAAQIRRLRLGDRQHQPSAPVVARPAAGLVQQADVGDPHAAVDRLAHVVDGERGDARRR